MNRVEEGHDRMSSDARTGVREQLLGTNRRKQGEREEHVATHVPLIGAHIA